MSKFEKDLSKGSVVSQLISFSVPFILSNLIQALYAVADMIIVGQFCGTNSMSGVNIGGQVTTLVTNMVVGLCAGATVLIGQYMGFGARKELKAAIGTLFSTLMGLGVILTVAMVFLRAPILTLINTPKESFAEAESYLFYTALGTLFIFGYNALSAVMRGMGDSKNPLIFVAIACVVNVGLDLLLIGVFKMSADGAALATVVSQAVSMILCIIHLKRNDFIFDFGLKSFGFDKIQLKKLIRVGIPSSVQNTVAGVSFLFLTAIVNTIGVTASAAVGAVGKFNSFGILPAIAMSAAISAMCAQNIGAGKIDRAVKTMKTGALLSFAMSVVVFAVSMLFPEQIIRIFADDPALVEVGVPYFRVFAFDYIIVSWMFALNGLFIGAGHTTFSLINSMCSSILVRIPAAYILGMVLDFGLKGVGAAAPLASLISAFGGLLFYVSGRWKKSTVLKDM